MALYTKDTEFEIVIGIEVHCQLNTNSKLFCPSANAFGAKPNTHVSPVNLALPGALPVLNKEAVRMAVMAGLALNCEIHEESLFARKNYFYPDLPKGYQISQFDKPYCERGYLDITVDGQKKRIGITRIHMEEDAGKLLHQGSDSIAGSTHSLVDLNRAGTALIEIVSEPDIRSASEARAYVETLKLIVQHIGICDGNMEEGSLRADVNISLREKGSSKFGTRSEIKNVNSFKSIEKAIQVEFERQKNILVTGGVIIQETRNFDEATQTTTSLRGKEDAHDYRYFPEPDLPPLFLSKAYIQACKASLPPLPSEKITEYSETYGFSEHEIKVLLGDVALDSYFRQVLGLLKNTSPKTAIKWLVGDFNAMLKEQNQSFSSSSVSPQIFADLVNEIESGAISGKIAKSVIEKLFSSNKSVADCIKELGGGQISDSQELETIVLKILKENLDVVEKIKAGKTASANFLMGQIMKETKGRAKPDLVNQLILDAVQKI
jgi:aspartyl-tRNA(Asn)/glutamyl-tRNA(Gln) amidotransferase subunit B